MCNPDNKRKVFKEENKVCLDMLGDILEEFGDTNVKNLTEEELEYILTKYAFKTFEVEEYDDAFYEEFYIYIPDVAPLSKEEKEELLVEYENRNIDDIIAEYESSVDVSDDLDDKESVSKIKQRSKKRGLRRDGRSKIKSKDKVNIKIIQTNCDGYTSKKESIENIVNDRQTDVLILNDTALKGKRKVRMKDYFSFAKNRLKAKGGVATVIANYLRPHTVKVGEGKEEDDEYIIVRLDHVIPAFEYCKHLWISGI